MSDKPIGWSGDDLSGYRLPEPTRDYTPPFEEVVDCGGVLVRRKRPEKAALDPETIRREEERARAFLDPGQRGELARQLIHEKYHATRGRR